MHWNLMNNEEFGSFQYLKLKYTGGGTKQISCSIELVSLQEIRSPLEFEKILQNWEKSPCTCKIYWNLTNEEEFGS